MDFIFQGSLNILMFSYKMYLNLKLWVQLFVMCTILENTLSLNGLEKNKK